nr:MAG TPA_asm: hypothetical protein [Bacteriophage sp.]
MILKEIRMKLNMVITLELDLLKIHLISMMHLL